MNKKSQSRGPNHRTEKMTPYMESWLKEIEEDRKTGKNFSGPFHSIAELKKHLEKKPKSK